MSRGRPFAIAGLVLGLLLTAAPPAPAAAPAEDPRDVRLKEISERLADLERALQGVNAQLEAASRAADLARSDVNRLQDRVKILEAGKPADGGTAAASVTPAPTVTSQPQVSPPAPTAAPSTAAPVATAEDGLTRGRKQLQGGDPSGAEATLTNWLAASPGDPRTAEGTYLRGRARALQSAWPDAASDYIAALKGWPATWWAPDAVVELARSLARLGKTAESCQSLAELSTRYPTAPEGARKRAAAISTQARCGT